jgi:hypothetical protein
MTDQTENNISDVFDHRIPPSIVAKLEASKKEVMDLKLVNTRLERELRLMQTKCQETEVCMLYSS